MGEAGLDAFIACTPANLFYTTGYRSAFTELSWRLIGTDVAVIPIDPDKPVTVLVCDYSGPDARRDADVDDVREYRM